MIQRGDIYRVSRPGGSDPRKSRPFVVVSRAGLIHAQFSSLVCAPIYSRNDGLASQVTVGPEFGLAWNSSIHCDSLISVSKAGLTDYVGRLTQSKMREVDRALAIALGIDHLLRDDA